MTQESDKQISEAILGKELGRGSYAEVYEVPYNEYGDPAALKVFKLGAEKAAEAEERVAVELGRDPNGVIIEMLGVGEQVDQHDKTRLTLLLEKVEGETVMEMITKGKKLLTLAEVVEFWKPLAEALDYARGKGWIYTDLHQDAVMVDKNNKPRLIDLSGFAKIGQHGDFYFTDRYADPHISRYGEVVSDTSDLYGVAGVLYLMFAGVGPTNDKNELSIKNSRVPMTEDQKQKIGKILTEARGRQGLFGRRFKTAGAIVGEIEKLI